LLPIVTQYLSKIPSTAITVSLFDLNNKRSWECKSQLALHMILTPTSLSGIYMMDQPLPRLCSHPLVKWHHGLQRRGAHLPTSSGMSSSILYPLSSSFVLSPLYSSCFPATNATAWREKGFFLYELIWAGPRKEPQGWWLMFEVVLM
jgi:hypothetical protein